MRRIEAKALYLAMVLVGCGAPEGGPGSVGEKTAAKPSVQASVAEQLVAANATADREMRLVARKFLNHGTEVAEFYEPVAGQILFSAAGSPKAGTVLSREQIEGKSAREVWAAVAPGEPIPQALADAIERARNPASASEADLARVLPEVTQETGGEAANARSARIVPLAGGYCSGQFWTDWGNWGAGSSRNAQTLNWGWNWQSWTNVTKTAGFIVCPQGNVSGTGGRLTINFPNGSTSSWEVGANYYRWSTWTAGADCGWDIQCWGTRCTPRPFNIYGKFESDCYLNKGTSCGDNYDWITFASTQGSYCENKGGGGGGNPPPHPTCNLTCYANCGNGCLLSGTTWCSYQDAQVASPGCGIYCGNDPANSATCYLGH